MYKLIMQNITNELQIIIYNKFHDFHNNHFKNYINSYFY